MEPHFSEQDAFHPVAGLVSCTSPVNQILFISQRKHFILARRGSGAVNLCQLIIMQYKLRDHV